MTPKEKAKELVRRYAMYLRANLMHDEEANEDAKQCALIAVDEIRDNIALISEIQNYWREVIQEIEKL